MMQEPQHTSHRTLIAGILIALIVLGLIVVMYRYFTADNDLKPTQPKVSQTELITESTPAVIEETAAPPPLPARHQLTVAFTPQAPTANWDLLHNEACEEASAIMANAFFNQIDSLPPRIVEEQITLLTNWQLENFGYSLSITTEETKQMIEAVYGLQAELTTIDEDLIKQALVDNKLVILPAAGRLLGNPNFTPPGPIYHMLVITGYDENGFITNDPGTRRGENYRYSYATLYESAGKYVHATKNMNTADKQILIVSKN